jgi:DNA-binding winged helix-turn-helix (wHTH) protein
VRFGTYEVSLQSSELRKSGLRIRVQQQPMKLLEILLERPGEVVTREELRSRVWPAESFGDFDQALNIAIGKLRSALGDAAENPRFIETLPKRGYRFIADVSVVDADTRTKRPEAAAGDVPGSQEQEKTESGHKLQGGGLAIAPKGRLWPSPHHRLGSGLEFADTLRLAISLAWQSAHGHPIPGGASAGEPLWRCGTELLR